MTPPRARPGAGSRCLAHQGSRSRLAARRRGMDHPAPTRSCPPLSALAETLDALAAGARPAGGVRGSAQRRAGGPTVEVLPHGIFDRLLLPGYSRFGVDAARVSGEQARATAGLAQRAPEDTHGVALVLGAGNITSIAPLDVLYQLYRREPRRGAEAQPGARAAPAGARADLRAVRPARPRPHRHRRARPRAHTSPSIPASPPCTSPEAPPRTTRSSSAPGDGAARAGRPVQPRLGKPITSELGGVSPVDHPPGRWSDSDLRFQAEHVATQKLHNAGHNCVASQVVMLPAAWPQKQRFLELLRLPLPMRRRGRPGMRARAPAWTRRPAGRVRRATASVSSSPASTSTTPPRRPGTTSGSDLSSASPSSQETTRRLPPHRRRRRQRAAARHARRERHRTPTHHPGAGTHLRRRHRRTSLRHDRRQRVDRPRLPDTSRHLGRVPWPPAHRHRERTRRRAQRAAAQGTERTVLRGPFRPLPKPPWFVTNRTAAVDSRRLTEFAARPRWTALGGIFASALRG